MKIKYFHNQNLAPIEEFCGKIKAAKDTQLDNHFCVVARTEAFISGAGIDEALKRAYAYKDAGADAILVHSKKNTSKEIELFCKHWDYSTPLITVPTTYPSTPIEQYEKLSISLVIWANHLLRTSISAMRKVAQKVIIEKSIKGISQDLSSVDDIFNLTDENELRSAEEKYMLYECPTQ